MLTGLGLHWTLLFHFGLGLCIGHLRSNEEMVNGPLGYMGWKSCPGLKPGSYYFRRTVLTVIALGLPRPTYLQDHKERKRRIYLGKMQHFQTLLSKS